MPAAKPIQSGFSPLRSSLLRRSSICLRSDENGGKKRTMTEDVMEIARPNVMPHPICAAMGWPSSATVRSVLAPKAALISAASASAIEHVTKTRRTPIEDFAAAWFTTFSPMCSFFPLRDVDPFHGEPQGERQLRGEGGQHDPGEQVLRSECRGQHLRQTEDYIAHTPDHQKGAEDPGQV